MLVSKASQNPQEIADAIEALAVRAEILVSAGEPPVDAFKRGLKPNDLYLRLDAPPPRLFILAGDGTWSPLADLTAIA